MSRINQLEGTGMEHKSRKRNAESGAAVAETAMIMSLLLLILFGAMEFATLFFNRGVIINASREGARFGAMFDIDTANGYIASPKTDAEIIQRVQQYSAGHMISFSPSSGSTPTVSVTPNWATRTTSINGGPIRVTVSYPFTFLLLPEIASTLVGGTTLTAQTSMRLE